MSYAPNGAPLSLNAKIEDRSAQVIVAAAKLVAGVATYRAIPSAQPAAIIPGARPERRGDECSEKTRNAVIEHSKSKAAVEEATRLLDGRVTELKALNERIEGLGSNVPESLKSALARNQLATSKAKEALEAKQKSFSALLRKIRHEHKLKWPVDGDARETKNPITLPLDVLANWIREDGVEASKAQAIATDWIAKAPLDVYLRIGSERVATMNSGEIEFERGIPIRQGVEGYFEAFTGKIPGHNGSESLKPDEWKKLKRVARRVDNLLQIGNIFYLPCVSRPFSSVECSYEMDEAGRLKKIGSNSSSATVEAGLGALGEVVKQAAEARNAKNSAALKQLEAQTAYLNAQAANKAAQVALAEDPNATQKATAAAFQAQASVYDAERAVIEAELALRQAQQRQQAQP
ncbi:MAG: hypothetical protein R3E48_00605 [Burkholderiaceae bacterium]